MIRAAVGAVASLALLAAPIADAAARAPGDKPKIPKEPVLSVYSETLTTDKVSIAPVSTGLAALTQGDPERAAQNPGINLAMYGGTLRALQGYLSALAKAGPRPDVVPQVTLQRSERPNAGAPSQNQIVLSTGLVDILAKNMSKDDAAMQQLLFILGHEYSHILYDHPTRFAAKKDRKAGIAKIFGTALVVAAVVNGVTADGKSEGAVGRKTIGAMQAALLLSPVIEMEIYRISYVPYKKNQESLADFASVDLMSKVGWGDPRDASVVLLQFEKFDNSLVAQLKSGLKRMGENFKASMTQLAAVAPGLMVNGGPQAVLKQAQDNLLRIAFAATVDFVKRRFNQDHIHVYYSSDKRVESVKAYADRFFPRKAEAVSVETASAWAGRANVAAPKAFASTYERENGPDHAATVAQQQLLDNNVAGARVTLDTAKAEYRRLVGEMPAPAGGAAGKGKKPTPKKGAKKPAASAPARDYSIRSTFFHMIDGNTYLYEGRIEEAATALKLSIAQPGAVVSTYIMLASALSMLNRDKEVLATLDKAGQVFGEHDVIIPKIRHYVATKQPDAAKALVEKCAAFPDIAKRCTEALPLVDANADKDDDDDDGAADNKDAGKGKGKDKATAGRKDDDDDD